MFQYLKTWKNNLSASFSRLPVWVKVFVVFSLFFGSLARFINLWNLGFLFDMVQTQYAWGRAGFEMGYFGFWKDYSGFFDYWPVSLLLEIVIYTVSLPFGGTPESFVAVMKLFNWFVEIVFCLSLFWLSWSNLYKNDNVEEKLELETIPTNVVIHSYFVASLAYLLPSLWFVSGVWGQNDTLLALLSFFVLVIMYKASDTKIDYTLKGILKDKMIWSGVLWALAFWLKQQAILILPVVIIFHLYKKTWLDIFKFFISLVIFGVNVLLAVNLYNAGDWSGSARWAFGTVLVTWLLLTFSLKFKGSWDLVRRQIWGFLTFTLFLLSPLLVLNYVRVGATSFAVAGRTDNVANGGATFWGLLDTPPMGSDALFKFGKISLSISTLGYVIYLLGMVGLIWVYYQIDWKKIQTFKIVDWFSHKVSFLTCMVLMSMSSILYFLFFTKMHSRYLHFGVIFSWIVAALLVRTKWFKAWLIVVVILNIGYFINQSAMFTIEIFGLKNTNPAWVYDFMAIFQSNPWKLSSLLSFASLLGLYYLSREVLLNHKNNKN